MRRNDETRLGVDAWICMRAQKQKLYIARRMGMWDNRRSDIRDPTVISKWLPCVLVCEFWTECTADRRQHGCSERSHAHINFAGVNVNLTNWPSAFIVWLSLWATRSRDTQTRYFLYNNESLQWRQMALRVWNETLTAVERPVYLFV